MDGENNGKPYFLMDDLGVPSRELTYPTLGSSENHLQKWFLMGYVSSLKGNPIFGNTHII